VLYPRIAGRRARLIDPDPGALVSPCDALVGACGTVAHGSVLQAKGFPYPLLDLLGDADLVRYYQGGSTRRCGDLEHVSPFPCSGRLPGGAVNYISGDTWNVNPLR